MGGMITLDPEVACGGHEAAAELLFPYSIHKHTSCQRRRIGNDGVCQFFATAALLEHLVGLQGKYRVKPPRHDRASLCRVASDMHREILRFSGTIFQLGSMSAVGKHM